MGRKKLEGKEKRFTNALEAGFPPELVEQVGACLDRLGGNTGFRHLTFQTEAEAPANRSESRIDSRLLGKCREIAARVKVRHIYFPRSSAPAVDIIDDEGVKFLRDAGVSTRTMMDIFCVATPVLYRHLGEAPAPGRRLPQIRNVDKYQREFQIGLEWLRVEEFKGRQSDKIDAKLVEKYSAGRICRIGQAIDLFRRRLKRDPVRA